MSVLLLCLFSTVFVASDIKPVFGKVIKLPPGAGVFGRTDETVSYSYDPATQASYVEHNETATWRDAVKRCAAEGAQLAAPRTRAEMHALLRFAGANTGALWIGMHDLFAGGFFTTLDGLNIEEAHVDWGWAQPNNQKRNEHCIQLIPPDTNAISRAAEYRVAACHLKCNFICKREQNKGVRPAKPFFREDYSYERGFDAFYKLHVDHVPWSEAVFMCAMEGAELAAPTSAGEMQLLRDLLWGPSAQASPDVIWIGINDIDSEGVFVFLNGTLVADVYANWAKDKPANKDGTENCVWMMNNGLYADVNCEQRSSYICKKKLSAVTKANTLCETYDTEYIYSLEADRCYKLHTVARKWHDAFRICVMEGAHLGIINSEDEAKIYRSIVKKQSFERLPGVFNRNVVLLGFNDLLSPGEFKSIKGETLMDAGFAEWSRGQPDNRGGNQHCGSMTVADGKLDDVGCQSWALFICEKDIKRPLSLDSTLKYGEGELQFCAA